ncbi:hypothetical protein [Spiroplasma endosymbiont of Lariophagus distinguendus]|nr:hypothetical protein [Spiroplasma endosymbiont of Lariophagus distinguendus]
MTKQIIEYIEAMNDIKEYLKNRQRRNIFVIFSLKKNIRLVIYVDC